VFISSVTTTPNLILVESLFWIRTLIWFVIQLISFISGIIQSEYLQMKFSIFLEFEPTSHQLHNQI
jgi:hypothetical protein